jgi:5'-methylthioadenosine phosphorylase
MAEEIRIGLLGGTGLGEALRQEMEPEAVRRHDVQTPFGAPSGPVHVGRYGDVPVALLQRHGDGHLLNPARVPYRANIYALKSLGCTHVLASGATGSLREDVHPGELVICDQLIDRTDGRERTFFESAAVHVEFADPFCPVMRSWLLDAAARAGDLPVHRAGCYLCMQGPGFSTRAESHLYRQWGADVVGMTALPEARLAREAELAYALIALPTDYDCWRPRQDGGDERSLLAEIIDNLRHATEASIRLIRAALADASPLRKVPSPAHDALALAIWSDKSKIERSEVERLSVLWGKYMEERD